jgi:ankyrin repeat protein
MRVAQLISDGADINATVNNGNTPLHQAAYRGHLGVVELLIVHGAEVNRRTNSGVTPLDWAKRNGHSAVVRILLAHGARYGAAHRSNSGLAYRQTQAASPQSDTLPDTVLFAALGNLPSLQRNSPPVTGSVRQARRLDEFRVQLAAMRNEAHAREMWRQFLSRHPDILAGLQPTVVPARVNGVPFYRIQGGPLTELTARNVCDQLKHNNQACLVVKVSAVARP